jgi:hypothetical protein
MIPIHLRFHEAFLKLDCVLAWSNVWCVQAYKLRAADAKERQYWVSRLRNEIERCTSVHSGYVKTQVCLRVYTV